MKQVFNKSGRSFTVGDKLTLSPQAVKKLDDEVADRLAKMYPHEIQILEEEEEKPKEEKKEKASKPKTK